MFPAHCFILETLLKEVVTEPQFPWIIHILMILPAKTEVVGLPNHDITLHLVSTYSVSLLHFVSLLYYLLFWLLPVHPSFIYILYSP